MIFDDRAGSTELTVTEESKSMIDAGKRLFVGIKISKSLQTELDNPAPGTKQYFDENGQNEYLQIINLGEHRIIGRYFEDGFLVPDIGAVSRGVGGMVKLISCGRRIEENAIQIYCS